MKTYFKISKTLFSFCLFLFVGGLASAQNNAQSEKNQNDLQLKPAESPKKNEILTEENKNNKDAELRYVIDDNGQKVYFLSNPPKKEEKTELKTNEVTKPKD